jgi:hypothetical protein
MWPFVIVFAHERIEASLLLQAVHPRRSRRLFFQGQKHALVATVLLRASWFDAFDGNAEPEPPDGELGEIEQAIWTGERNAVVGSDGLRLPRDNQDENGASIRMRRISAGPAT